MAESNIDKRGWSLTARLNAADATSLLQEAISR
jgi:hypothetical protein